MQASGSWPFGGGVHLYRPIVESGGGVFHKPGEATPTLSPQAGALVASAFADTAPSRLRTIPYICSAWITTAQALVSKRRPDELVGPPCPWSSVFRQFSHDERKTGESC